MTKKNDMSNIKSIGIGILDSLSGIKEEKNINVLQEKSKLIKDEKSKGVENKRSKRSFMLSEDVIQKLGLLKLCMNDKDLSMIVEESISMYFDKNKNSIEELISLYNKLK